MSQVNDYNSSSTGVHANASSISISMGIKISLNYDTYDDFKGDLSLYICALAAVLLVSAVIEILFSVSTTMVKPVGKFAVFCQAITYAVRLAFVYMVMLSFSVMTLKHAGMYLVAAVAGHGLGFFLAKMEEVAAAPANEANNVTEITSQVGA